MGILYRPADGVAGDFIPFWWEGDYHLFYLKDYRGAPGRGEGVPWWHLVTRDFVHFDDWGEALPRGPAGAQDQWVFTGSVLAAGERFHIFYTGHNPQRKQQGGCMQAVLRADSDDLRAWTKRPEFFFPAPAEEGYEPDDWRDPFVFWNDEAKEYWMLLAARRAAGPPRHRGLIALAASKDLHNWEVREPFWAPDLYYTHECPDLFRIGEWWYLVYSTFSERCVTHYRMSRSLAGPWMAPADDAFDARAYYAAKTAGDGERRFVFGWLPTRQGDKDDGGWQWGGELVVHELVQRGDGTLAARLPATVAAAFRRPLSVRPAPVLGPWDLADQRVTARCPGRLAALTLGRMPAECLIDLTLEFAPGTAAAGVLLRAADDLASYYQLRLEPAARRIVFDRWPRPGDQPFMLERPLALEAGRPVRLRIVVDGTCLVAYADDEVALSCRMYDHGAGQLGLFAAEGEAAFGELAVKIRG